MDKQEAKKRLELYRDKIAEFDTRTGYQVTSLDGMTSEILTIAIECIDKCIGLEESPCTNCQELSCNKCLYSGRLG